MTRNLMILAVVFVAFLLGLFLGKKFEVEPGRAARGIELFEKYCVPLIPDNTRVVDMERSELALLGTGVDWADPESKLILSFGPGQCSISDPLLLLTPAERREFKIRAEELIENNFPNLQPDENHGLKNWDLFQLWASHEAFAPERWMIGLSRNSSSEIEPTELSLSSTTSLWLQWSE